MPYRRTLLALVLLVAGLAAAAPARAAEPWQDAQAVTRAAFASQSELLLGSSGQARAEIARARRVYRRIASDVRGADAAADRAARRALANARSAVLAGNERALASARGSLQAALYRGSFALATGAAARGDADSARAWLLVREFRAPTRYTRPGADATLALRKLAARSLTPAAARDAVTRDLLDAYGARLRDQLTDVRSAQERKSPVRAAEAAARARGYWTILAGRFAADRGAPAQEAVAADLDLLAREAGTSADVTPVLDRLGKALAGFQAAPLTPGEAARRAQQLLRFVELVPVEYGRGVKEEDGAGRVTLDFEVQEAVAFRSASDTAFEDLRDLLAKRDANVTEQVAADIASLGTMVGAAAAQKPPIPTPDAVEAKGKAIDEALRSIMPAQWLEPTDDSDYDLIALALDRMETASSAGHRAQAEQARLEAYAFFEFGPERRLNSFDPKLATEVEGLIWFGARDVDGLAELVARRAPRREIHETRLVLDEALEETRITLGDEASTATVITNSAVLVFREGLEAVLILAAITASFIGARRRLRRPVLIGAMFGLLASILTWVLAITVLDQLSRYGEKLEAVVGLVAIGVLILITNWFFHRVYWSEWIGRFHRQRRKLMNAEATGFFSAQAVGLVTLGLTSVYREGFETVLFLQSLQLSAGTPTVVAGAGLGLALTLGVAALTFGLQRKLPYKRMLILTGVLISLVLVIMVGQTARTMQGTTWLPVHPIDVEFPYWLGQWFGVFPTIETIVAQIVAFVFVIGSYFLAQELRVKRPQRRGRRAAEAAGAADGGEAAVAALKAEAKAEEDALEAING